MEKRIKINFPSYKFELVCKLNNSSIAEKIYSTLPQESTTKIWGDEIYFYLPLNLSNENPTLDVKIGDVGWWPEGKCFCIFFGRTPISDSENPKPYSEITLIGKIEITKEIVARLKSIKSNSKVILEKL
ncbi:MAG: cyclophilin-like fold protein [Endomicrobiia bacterium]